MRTKKEEMEDPNSCWNRAKMTEPVFVLIGRDSCAPGTIENWCDRRVQNRRNGFEDAQIQEALEIADVMRQYERDLYGDTPNTTS